MNRDEYVQKLKTQIDAWNAEAARWMEMMRAMEASAKSMQDAFERARRSFDKK
jgi:lipid II:glycine glycyltransferase (peptidoglycan interpeptide bridge formation enzyme)